MHVEQLIKAAVKVAVCVSCSWLTVLQLNFLGRSLFAEF